MTLKSNVGEGLLSLIELCEHIGDHLAELVEGHIVVGVGWRIGGGDWMGEKVPVLLVSGAGPAVGSMTAALAARSMAKKMTRE